MNLTRICHGILKWYYSFSWKKFSSGKNSLEAIQRKKLKSLVASLKSTRHWQQLDENKMYEDLITSIPLSDYSTYDSIIEEQKKTSNALLCSAVQRYEPTSGSTQARKWIPYSKEFLNEINQAAMSWMADVYHQFPEVKNGVHYWSLSWLPEELRSQTSTNDAELFPFYQRWILQNTMAVSAKIAFVKNPQAAWWATLISLAAREDLVLVSVWSPTFWLKITEDIKTHWSEIQSCLAQGHWGKFQKELNKELGVAPLRNLSLVNRASENFFQNIWPNLKLISAWDSSSSSGWARKIQNDFKGISFQGKGLWATEGVVTIPFSGKKVLSYQSHFYEFRDLESGEILPSWQLKMNGYYQPILWSSSGFLRYALQDRVKVVDFFGDVPCFEFQGRMHSTDLVGEKLDAVWVEELFEKNKHWNAITLVAVQKPSPRYIMFHGSSQESVDIESALLSFHHYKVARELGQLAVAENIYVKDVFSLWESIGKSKLIGQNKIEVLQEIEFYKS